MTPSSITISIGWILLVASFQSIVLCRRQLDEETYGFLLDEYYECMNKREARLQRLQKVPFLAAVGLRGSSTVLSCFDCLSPEMQLELENDKEEGKLRMAWQHLSKTVGAKWNEVAVVGVGNVDGLESFARRPNNIINERLDLQLNKLTRNHTGWYRCVEKKRSATAAIGNVYHLDDIPGIVNPSTLMEEPADLRTYGVTMVNEWTEWSNCNQCGVAHAERRRRSICYIQQSPQATNKVPMLKLFDRLPCESSLLPLDVRATVGNQPIIEAVDICQVPCPSKPKTRVIKELDSGGVEKVRDVLPPGEFSSLESLPPLPAPVDRRTHLVKEGDPCIIDCPHLYPGAKHWRRNNITLTVAYLFHHNRTRVFVDANFRLHFLRLEFDDSALYSCWSWDKKLLATADVRVERLNKTEELIAYVRMFIGFAALLLLFLLVATKIARTKGDSRTAVDATT
uniref:Ig-like domain-containing protein n=1 Tax=Plectus sambesii TaxID=2011161 RepID=A0A914VU98_9BILA